MALIIQSHAVMLLTRAGAFSRCVFHAIVTGDFAEV